MKSRSSLLSRRCSALAAALGMFLVAGFSIQPATGSTPVVSRVTSSLENANYNDPDVIPVQVVFSQAVVVTGTPQITLETGSVDQVVNYASGSGTTTLTFNYTIQLGDNSPDLDYVSTSALALNGGTIQNSDGIDADLTLPAVGGASSLGGQKNFRVDTDDPRVVSVSASSLNGSYEAGNTITVTVTFDEPVSAEGTPKLLLNSGGTAFYAGGSETASLIFNYTVNPFDGTVDLDYFSIDALTLNGGLIRDLATNWAVLTLPAVGGPASLGGQKDIVIDTRKPRVVNVSSSSANGLYKVGDTVAVTVTFDEIVFVEGTPTLGLNSGGTASYASGQGSTTLTFNYTVSAGDTAADLNYVATSSLAQSGGFIRDGASNWATLTLPAVGGASSLGGQKNIAVDGLVPVITSVAVPANATYVAGQNLDFTVSFDQNVTVAIGGGTPSLGVTLDTGGSIQAAYLAGSGTSALVFRATVASGQFDDNGIALAGGLALNGGTLRDAVGNDANLTLNSVGSTAAILVDSVAPAASAIVRAGSTPTSATSLDYTVTFSEGVTGVDAGDFTVTSTGTAAGAIASVNAVNGSTYTVTVNAVSGDGTLRVDLSNTGTGIADTPGNAISGGFTTGQVYTIDQTAPAAVTVVSISNDSGASSTDHITNDTTLVLAGTADANIAVSVMRDGTPIGSTTADGSGAWSLDYTATTLPAGAYAFTATATDTAGNTSSTSSPLHVTIDTAAPAAPAITAITDDTGASSTDQLTTDATLVLSGTAEANGTVTLFRNTVQIGVITADGTGAWSYDFTGTALAEGTHTFDANTTDAAGNTSNQSAAFLVEIDVSTPAAPAITAISTDSGASSTDGITNDATLVLSGTADANATVTISRSGAGAVGTATANGSGAWSFDYSGTTLVDGDYIFTAFASDTAGNAGAVSADFPVTIDTTAPVIDTQPVGGTYGAFGSFDVSVGATDSTAMTYQWHLDGSPVANSANRSGATTATLSHTNISLVGFAGAYAVAIVDLAGNSTSSTPAFVLVNKADQTITFPVIADQLTTATPFAVNATASSGLAVTLSVVSGPASLAGNTVTITGAPGSVTIRATQAGDSNYNPVSVDRTFVVTTSTATVTLGSLNHVYDGAAKSASATTSPGGLTVAFTYNGSSTAPVNAGSYAVVATIVDNSFTYNGTASGTLTISPVSAGVSLGSLAQTYSGAARTATATTTPAGLSVGFTYNGSPTAPINAGSYAVVATISDPNYFGSANGTLVVGKADQSIDFAPVGAISVGVPVALDATASSGLPVTIELLSGNGVVFGASLTANDGNPITLRATQAGNSNYNPAASVDQVVSNVAKLAQTITFAQPADKLATDASFALSASASSGLPVSLAVQSGPATISGNTVTLTGAAGTVTIVATQAGDASYAAALSVTRSFTVTAVGSLTYFGTITDGTQTQGEFAAHLAADQGSGVLIGYLPGQSGGFVVNFTPDSNRAFSVNVSAITNQSVGGGGIASAPANWTFSGQLSGNAITGSIAELALTFAGVADPLAGPAAPLAGYYKAAELGTSAGTMHFIVGTAGDVQALAVTSSLIAGATGIVTPSNGDLAVTLAGGASIDANIDAATTVVDGTLVLSGGAMADFLGLRSDTTRTDRLANISTRGRAGLGENILITGFAISGTESKRVLIRAVGPGLATFGVPGTLPNPRIDLYRDGVLIEENDDWAAGPNVQELVDAMQQTGAFGLDAQSLDAALVRTLAPGSYTAHVSDPSGQGVALAEIYDASANPGNEVQRLVNISTRGHVGTGDNILIGGFVVTGNAPKRVLVRAIGPTLAGFGVAGALADPQLRLFAVGGAELANNDDWGVGANTEGELVAAATATGAFALNSGSRDAVVLVTLAPGGYTAHVSGGGSGTGVALIEVYEGQLP